MHHGWRLTVPGGGGPATASCRVVRGVCRYGRWRRLLIVSSLLCLFSAPGLAGFLPAATAAPAGQEIFAQKCAGCHTVGGGRSVAADLQGITARRERDWLVRFIAAPDRLRASGDPIAGQLPPMPNLGLTQEEVEAVVAYLAGETGAAPAAPAPAPAAPAIPGDAEVGRELFTGARIFQAGGPSCLTCHRSRGAGGLGGGTLGGDLTGATGRYGEAGLASLLGAFPFPTMKPVYDRHPLTAEEQAHLLAFLRQAAGEPEAVHPSFGLLGLEVLLFFLLLAAGWGRRRRRSVRRDLLARAVSGRGEG